MARFTLLVFFAYCSLSASIDPTSLSISNVVDSIVPKHPNHKNIECQERQTLTGLRGKYAAFALKQSHTAAARAPHMTNIQSIKQKHEILNVENKPKAHPECHNATSSSHTASSHNGSSHLTTANISHHTNTSPTAFTSQKCEKVHSSSSGTVPTEKENHSLNAVVPVQKAQNNSPPSVVAGQKESNNLSASSASSSISAASSCEKQSGAGTS